MMKRLGILFGLILSVSFLLTGCNKAKTDIVLFPEEVTTVDVSYMDGEGKTMWELDEQELAQVKKWANALELEHKTFEEGRSPGDADGGNVYDFSMNDGEMSFSYVNSDGSYILHKDEWYKVKNPSDPPMVKPVETEPMVDRIPMAMVGGKLYYDTGKVSTLKGRCGTMDGEITSTVARSETPTDHNQSNFGSGIGYQYGANDTIEVCLNDKWVIFEHRSGNGNQIRFGDKWVDEDELSEETIAWLTERNTLPEELQLATSYVPNDLLKASGLTGRQDAPADEASGNE